MISTVTDLARFFGAATEDPAFNFFAINHDDPDTAIERASNSVDTDCWASPLEGVVYIATKGNCADPEAVFIGAGAPTE